MSVAFGTPSAEQVPITAGMPLSRTGRISGGSSTAISRLRLGEKSLPGPGTWGLQEDFLDLELDGELGVGEQARQHVLGFGAEEVPRPTQPALADALRDLAVPVVGRACATSFALELIGLVGGEGFDRDRELAVVGERLGEAL